MCKKDRTNRTDEATGETLCWELNKIAVKFFIWESTFYNSEETSKRKRYGKAKKERKPPTVHSSWYKRFTVRLML